LPFGANLRGRARVARSGRRARPGAGDALELHELVAELALVADVVAQVELRGRHSGERVEARAGRAVRPCAAAAAAADMRARVVRAGLGRALAAGGAAARLGSRDAC